MKNTALFELEHVTVSIQNQVLLNDLNVIFKPTGVTGIIGASGSGKSTFLKLLNRLLEPTSGTILYNGSPLSSYNPRILRREVAYVQQRPYLFSGTVRENLLYGPKLWKLKYDLKDLIVLLKQVGLDESFLEKNVSVLSGGEQQRVNVARFLANQPKVLLMDEPTSGLDVYSQDVLENTILELNRRGVKIIIVTHDLEQAKRICDDLIFLKDKTVYSHSSKDYFFSSLSLEEIKELYKLENNALKTRKEDLQ